jgi:molecular chaperone DnaK
MEQGVVEVLASHGNNQLGGDDFDQKIVTHVLEHIKTQHGVDATASRQAMARITRAAEAAKITLSDYPFARLEEEYLLDHQGAPIHLSLEIARSDYEAMIEAYIDETLEAVHIALSGAGLTVSQLDEVLLVGGATRTPVIQRRLEQELHLPPHSEVDPELCVASGAAIQAAVIAGTQVSRVLVDITPYTFGTSAISELNGEIYPYTFIPLIRKNTAIPVAKSEVFHTAFDNQETVEVMVYQGEDPDALNNTEIGRFLIEGLSRVPHGNQILTTFSLDLNGILHVAAKEKRTGLEKSITIDNAMAHFKRDEMEQARERIGALLQDTANSDTTTNRQITKAQALIEKATRLLDTAGEEDREDLINLIEAVKDALDAEDPVALSAATDELSDLIFYLGT